MSFNKTVLLAFGLLPLALAAQDPIPAPKHVYQQEFAVVSENDNFTLQLRDGYYTNGLYLRYSHALDLTKSKAFGKKPTVKKVIDGFQVGQAIFNPISYNRTLPAQQDRPFAGYLAATFDRQIFYDNNAVYQWGVSLGTIGPNSYAANVQRWYHGAINIYDVKGWPYQLKNEMSLNVSAAYYRSLMEEAPSTRRVNVDAFGKVNIGNAFTNANIGGTLKLGLVEDHYNSSHWRAGISAPTGTRPRYDHELYLFVEPMLTVQAYNAVLQGGMFIKDKGPKTVSIEPLVFTHRIGVRYSQNRFTTAIIYVGRTREAKTQIRNEKFVSIQVAYRFGRLGTMK